MGYKFVNGQMFFVIFENITLHEKFLESNNCENPGSSITFNNFITVQKHAHIHTYIVDFTTDKKNLWMLTVA